MSSDNCFSRVMADVLDTYQSTPEYQPTNIFWFCPGSNSPWWSSLCLSSVTPGYSISRKAVLILPNWFLNVGHLTLFLCLQTILEDDSLEFSEAFIVEQGPSQSLRALVADRVTPEADGDRKEVIVSYWHLHICVSVCDTQKECVWHIPESLEGVVDRECLSQC